MLLVAGRFWPKAAARLLNWREAAIDAKQPLRHGISKRSMYSTEPIQESRFMKFENLNRWLTLGANIGVVVGIVFLIVEINQNTVATRIAARDSATQGHIDYMALAVDQTVLAEAMAKAVADQELSYLDSYQLEVFHEIRFRHYQRVFYQYQNGVLSEREWAAYQSGIRQSFRDENAGWEVAKRTWAITNHKLSPNFVAYVEKLVADDL